MKNYQEMLVEIRINRECLKMARETRELYIQNGEYEGTIKIYDTRICLLEKIIDIQQKHIETAGEILKKAKGKMDTQSTIWVMYHLEHISPKDIARKLPCDISTVYRNLKKFDKMLQ